jgi:hypothetical protein
MAEITLVLCRVNTDVLGLLFEVLQPFGTAMPVDQTFFDFPEILS